MESTHAQIMEIKPSTVRNSLRGVIKIGVSTPGLSAPEHEVLESLRPGLVNFTLAFFRNCEMSDDGVSSMKEKIIQTVDAVRSILPDVLISFVHEGGMIQNLKPPNFSLMPPSRSLGNHVEDHHDDLANVQKDLYSLGRTQGRAITALGLDWNFAPVVDVSTDPNYYFRPSGRAFHDNPEFVIEASSPLVSGMQQEGLACCLKHYPGMGCTDADSHSSRPTIPLSRSLVIEPHARVFRDVFVASGVKSMMTNHAVYPSFFPPNSIGPLPCATFSRSIMHDLLREDFQFDGILVTDELGMYGVREEPIIVEDEDEEEGIAHTVANRKIGPMEVACRSLLAGCDVLLWGYHIHRPLLAYLGILRAFGLEEGEEEEAIRNCEVLQETSERENDTEVFDMSDETKEELYRRLIESSQRVRELKEWRERKREERETGEEEDFDTDNVFEDVMSRIQFPFEDPVLEERYARPTQGARKKKREIDEDPSHAVRRCFLQ